MPLETLLPNARPDDLNKDWPEDSDDRSEGAAHLRNVKLAMENFYAASGLARMPKGTIPAILDTEFIESGMQLEDGQFTFLKGLTVPSIFYQFIGEDYYRLPPSTPLDVNGGARTQEIVTQPEVEVVTQPLDEAVNAGPLEYITAITGGFLLTEWVLRGVTTVQHVRLTIRRDNATGPIVYQSASDDELRLGEGVTISSVGDTVLPVIPPTILSPGSAIHVKFERYDTVAEAVVDDGIRVKGVFLSPTDFRPYTRQKGFPWEYKELARLEDIGGVKPHVETSGVNVGISETVIASATFSNMPAGQYLVSLDSSVAIVENGEYTFRLRNSGGGLISANEFELKQGDTPAVRTFGTYIHPAQGDLIVSASCEGAGGDDELDAALQVIRLESI